MFERGIVGVRLGSFRLHDRVFYPSQRDLSFLEPDQCMVAQFVFHTLRLMQREHDQEYQQALFRDADVFRLSEEVRLRQSYAATGSALLPVRVFIERYRHSLPL